MSPELRADILHYYADTSIPFATKKKAKEWAQVLADLNELKAAPASAPPTPVAGRPAPAVAPSF